MLKKIRLVLFWTHLVLGVASALVALLLCLTGTLLAVDLPVTNAFDRARVSVPAQHAPIPSVTHMVDAAIAAREDGTPPQSIRIGRRADDPVIASWGRRDTLQLGPWSGANLGQGAAGVHSFFGWNMRVHRWFALEGDARDAARQVTGWATMMMVLLIPTGLLLWIPRPWKWKKVKAVALPRRGKYGKGLEFQWHNAFGLWVALPLFFFALTGAAIGFDWLNDALVRAGGGHIEANNSRPTGDDTPGDPNLETRLNRSEQIVVAITQHEPDWHYITLQIPADANAPFEATVDTGNGRQYQHQTQLEIARETLVVNETRDWNNTPRERQVRLLIRFGHTGEMFGTAGIFLAMVVSAIGGLLAYTGLALSFRRWRRWRRKKARA